MSNRMAQQPLPGAGTVLTMGILSIVGTLVCWWPLGGNIQYNCLGKGKNGRPIVHDRPRGIFQSWQYKDGEDIGLHRFGGFLGLPTADHTVFWVYNGLGHNRWMRR